MDCLFCKILNGSIPSTKVFENDQVIGFNDLGPQAAKHYLFIHRNHTSDVNDMMENDPDQVKDIFLALKDFSQKEGLDQKGFRVVTNLGAYAGQTVFHTHFHLVAGEPLGRFGR